MQHTSIRHVQSVRKNPDPSYYRIIVVPAKTAAAITLTHLGRLGHFRLYWRKKLKHCLSHHMKGAACKDTII